MKASLATLALLAGLFSLSIDLAFGSPVIPVGPLQEPAPKESLPKDDEAIEMAELFVKVVDEDGDPVFKASVLLNVLPEVRDCLLYTSPSPRDS